MAARKKKSKKSSNGHGGKRPGAGRPKATGREMDKGIFTRCDEEQYNAIFEYVEELNDKREAKGLKRLPLSTWAREVMLQKVGRSDLGIEREAKKAEESARAL